MKELMGQLADRIGAFSSVCHDAEYTDTGDAWELLNYLHTELRKAAKPVSTETPDPDLLLWASTEVKVHVADVEAVLLSIEDDEDYEGMDLSVDSVHGVLDLDRWLDFLRGDAGDGEDAEAFVRWLIDEGYC